MSLWFESGIEEAIKTARSKNAIFVIYIEDSERETTLHYIIENCTTQELLRHPNFVCIRILSNSSSYRDFSNIYQLVPVPSIFFIGSEGWPLEIISGELTENDIINRIKSLMTLKTSSSSDSMLSCDGRQSNEQAASDMVSNEERVSVPKEEEKSSVPKEEGKLSVSKEERKLSVPKEDKKLSVPKEDKKLSVPKEEEKTSVPNEEEKSKDSHDLSTSTEKKRLDQTSSTSISLLMNEETLNESISSTSSTATSLPPATPPSSLTSLASHTSSEAFRVRDPDASSSASRTGSSILRQAAKRLQEHMEDQTSVLHDLPGRSSETTKYSRIQFRLPDGLSHLHNFLPETTIGEVRVYVRTNINLPYKDFSMSTGYPRFELSDPEQTLGDLNMLPTAVILINPVVTSLTPTYMSMFRDTLMYILTQPLSAVNGAFTYLYQRLFGSAIEQSGESVDLEDDDPPFTNPIHENRPSVRHRRSVQREGNVHRLSNRSDDSDDDNNTWNGNSTQQM